MSRAAPDSGQCKDLPCRLRAGRCFVDAPVDGQIALAQSGKSSKRLDSSPSDHSFRHLFQKFLPETRNDSLRPFSYQFDSESAKILRVSFDLIEKSRKNHTISANFIIVL